MGLALLWTVRVGESLALIGVELGEWLGYLVGLIGVVLIRLDLTHVKRIGGA